MNEPTEKIYPDLAAIWERKKQRRLARAKLPITEKLELIKKWREGIKDIKGAKLIDKPT